MKGSTRGFTLAELMVTVAVVGVIVLAVGLGILLVVIPDHNDEVTDQECCPCEQN